MFDYQVYKHTFSNGKSYIGYTGIGISARMHKHYINAMAGMQTKFYRAIRKYGLEDIKTEILYETNNQDEAIAKEIYYIAFYDTYKTGYNMTMGGDGGNCIRFLTPEKLKGYRKSISNRTTGEKNPNHSGITDQQILDEAQSVIVKTGKLTIKAWRSYCKSIGHPQNYTKCRFDGSGYAGFLRCLKDHLTKNGVYWDENTFRFTKEELYTKERSEKISKAQRKFHDKNKKTNE